MFGLAWVVAAPAGAQGDDAALLRELRAGAVVLMRHAQTTPGVGDPPGWTLERCETQRNLAPEGIAHARRIGQWFKAKQLRVGVVRSSPWCRTRDTAQLAFGRHDEHSPFWGYASQLAWQHRSGRLGREDGAIATDSWWGACNHALSVVPYVAAMRVGLVPALPIAAPPRFVPVMAAWRDAFAAMTRTAPVDHDRVSVAIWRAHLASPRFDPR